MVSIKGLNRIDGWAKFAQNLCASVYPANDTLSAVSISMDGTFKIINFDYVRRVWPLLKCSRCGETGFKNEVKSADGTSCDDLTMIF